MQVLLWEDADVLRIRALRKKYGSPIDVGVSERVVHCMGIPLHA
jgi:hypothetical protein